MSKYYYSIPDEDSIRYVRELSAPKGKQRTFTCWKCDITYTLKVKEHIMIVELTRAR